MSVNASNRVSTSIPVVISNPNIFSNSITFYFTGGLNPLVRTNFSDSYLNLSLRFDTANDGIYPVKAIRPALAWIRHYTLNLVSKTGESYNEASMSKRGEVGAAMAILQQNYCTTLDTRRINSLIAPFTITNNIIQISLPLKYLMDLFGPEKYLDVASGQATLDFLPDTECFYYQPQAGKTTVTCTACDLLFDSYTVDPDTNPYYLYPDARQVYTQNFQQAAGTNQVTLNLATPGPLLFLCIYFGSYGDPVTNTAPNLFNAWRNSLPSFIQISNMSGKTWPPNPAFKTDATPPFNGNSNTVNPSYDWTFGYNRFYRDLLSVIGQLGTNKNTFVDVDRWLETYRFYAIELSDDTQGGGVYVLNMVQTAKTLVPLNVQMFGVYIKTQSGNASLSQP